MTVLTQPAPPPTAPDTRGDGAATSRRSRRKGHQRVRRGMVVLALLAAAFIGFSVVPYVSLDPARSRVPSTFVLHYPFLVAHVLFGSIAMATCVLQMWPWFRRRYPAAHRVIGQVYVFAGVVPAALLGLVLSLTSPFGPVIGASGAVLTPLWLAITIAGWRMARQRRYQEHRRWMIRSFAITFSFITNRLWGPILAIALSPQLETTFDGNETAFMYSVAGMSAWLGWVIPLVIAQWYLEREDAARHRARITRGAAARQAVHVDVAR